MARHRQRKPLRERVAARKAGRPVEDEDTATASQPWRKWMSWTGAVLQVAALVLVLVETFRLIQSGFVGTDLGLVIVYLVVFFIGRVLQLIANFKRR